MDSNDLPGSMKNLWTLLSGSLNLKSLQFIANELETNQKQLLDGILYYKPHDIDKDSLVNIKNAMKNNCFKIKPTIVYNLSSLLNLSSQQCLQLIQSYLLYEFNGTPEMARTLFSSEKNLKKLFEDLWHYYYSERIFGLFCLKQILSNWKESDHIYAKIFHDFLEHINQDEQISKKLIEQLRYLINVNEKTLFKPRIKTIYYISDQTFNEFPIHQIKEQIEILQLLLLYYKHVKPKPKEVLEILKLLNVNKYESTNTIEKNIDCMQYAHSLHQFCAFLKSLLIVQFFDPNGVRKCQNDDVEHYLFRPENSDLIKQMHEIVINLNSTLQENSLIFFSWTIINLFCSFENNEDDNNDNENIMERLGNNALQLKMFAYIEHFLLSEQMDLLKTSLIHRLVYEIIGNLFEATFTMLDFEKLIHNDSTLTQLLIHLFSNDMIARIVLDSGLSIGFGLLLRYVMNFFPYKIHLTLSLLNSLSQTTMCRNLFEQTSIMNVLVSYTETFEGLNPDEYRVSHTEPNAIVLIYDRHLYNDHHLCLNKGSIGIVQYYDNNRIVQWKNLSLYGWRLLYSRMKFMINQIKQGNMYSTINEEIVLYEISKITFICSELIGHNSHTNIMYFKNIIELLFELFQLIVSVEQTSIRLFMASIIKLCSKIIQQNYMDLKEIWSTLNDKRFFPYMIGFTNRFDEILNGTDTNISTLSYILASEEFINGNYELTISFLSLMMNLIKNDELNDDNSIIASFVFIINDIFPSYKLWNYRNEHDMHRIGLMCMQIFHHIINRVRRKVADELLMIEKICIVHLIEGKAAEQLLSIIKNGEEVVKRKIQNSGNEFLLVEDDQIISIRTSISILCYLLEIYSEISKLSSSKDKSVIEKIIFSSTNNNNPNMLLIFIHFICQKYDIHLAINALQLINQLAFKFPMSMLACFGSQTEFIRDHFLCRLEKVTEDINFKIALLNFLSACVEYQPGLAEMFLNASSNGNIGNNESSNKDQQQQISVLASIINILEEKYDGIYHCPYEFHYATLQFIVKFWLKPNLLAMNKLKSYEKFWLLLTFPLFRDKDDKNKNKQTYQIDNSLCSFILKILSHEIHYVKMLEKCDNLNDNLKKILTKIIDENVLENFSSHIFNSISNDQRNSIDNNFINFIDGWRDFITSWIKFIAKKSDESKVKKIINDVLQYIFILIENDDIPITKTMNILMNKFSNLLPIILTSISNKMMDELSYEMINKIFKQIVKHKDQISLNSQISIGVFAIKLINEQQQSSSSSSDNDHQNNQDLFYSIVELLNNSFRLMNKQQSLQNRQQQNLQLEKRLIIVYISIIVKLMQQKSMMVKNELRYLKILKYFSINEQIQNMFIYFIHKRLHLDLVQLMMLYFITLSLTVNGSNLMNTMNLIEQFVLNFSEVKLNNDNNNIDEIDYNNNYDIIILSQMIPIVNNMIINLKHYFIENCITFIAIYMNIFQKLFEEFRRKPTKNLINLIQSILELLSLTSKYSKQWKQTHPSSFYLITNQILLSSNVMISFLLRPSLMIKTFRDNSNNNDEDNKSKEIDFSEQLQTMLIKMLLKSMKYILNISPEILELISNEIPYDCSKIFTSKDNNDSKQMNLLLSINFSYPNIDSNDILTFGSLASLINFLIKQEKDCKKSSENINIDFKSFNSELSLLELSLLLFFIQTFIAKYSFQKINLNDEQRFFHEINNELNTFKSNLKTSHHPLYPRRQTSSSSMLKASPTPKLSIHHQASANLSERPFIKLIFKLMENILN